MQGDNPTALSFCLLPCHYNISCFINFSSSPTWAAHSLVQGILVLTGDTAHCWKIQHSWYMSSSWQNSCDEQWGISSCYIKYYMQKNPRRTGQTTLWGSYGLQSVNKWIINWSTISLFAWQNKTCPLQSWVTNLKKKVKRKPNSLAEGKKKPLLQSH